jgi:chorismate mutase
MDVEGALPRTIRVLVNVMSDKARAEIQHIYLRGATALRLDLAQ